MTVKELMDIANKSCPEHLLDELVDEVYSEMASRINNGGVYEQITTLLDNGYTVPELFGMIMNPPETEQ